MNSIFTKKNLLCLSLCAILTVSFTSCGAVAKNEAAYDSAPMEFYAETERVQSSGGLSGKYYDAADSESYDNGDYKLYSMTEDSAEAPSVETTSRKIIYTSSYEIQTKEYDKAYAALEAIMSAHGAYFESSNTYGRPDSGSRRSDFTIRVPVKNYTAFTSEAGTIGVVISSSQNNRDVTESYFDTEARLESAKIREERVLEILKNASKLDDILALERELSEIRYEIESFSGTLRKYDSLVNYSTVTIRLQEVSDVAVPKATPLTFGERMSKSFARGMNDFVDGVQDLAVILAYNFIGVIIWLVIIISAIIALCVISKRNARRRAKAREGTEKEKK